MQSEAPNINHPQPELQEKIGRAITALSELSDVLPSGDDRNPILEQLEAKGKTFLGTSGPDQSAGTRTIVISLMASPRLVVKGYSEAFFRS